MRKISFLFILLFSATVLHSQSCKKKYKHLLEANSKLLDCDWNYTVEKLKNGSCILKMYYPDTEAIIEITTYKDEELLEKHGIAKEFWDDGTLISQGYYKNNQKVGNWISNRNETGLYKNDAKHGIWKKITSDSILLIQEFYIDGRLHGPQMIHDTTKNISFENIYHHGELMSTTLDSTIHLQDEKPRFPGCEDENIPIKEKEACANEKLLRFIYTNIKYPREAREQNIQGTAIVRCTVSKNGEIKDVKALRGLSDVIKKEVFRIIESMPRWRPGMKDGKPVDTEYTLPVNFNLR